MDKKAETEVIERALAAACANGLNARLVKSKGRRGDRKIHEQVQLSTGTKYQFEVKTGLRPATLGAAIHQLKSIGPLSLLVADYITPPIANTLRENNIPFLDADKRTFQTSLFRTASDPKLPFSNFGSLES